MAQDESTVRFRSIYAAQSLPGDEEAKSGVPVRNGSTSLTATDDDDGVGQLTGDVGPSNNRSGVSAAAAGGGEDEGIFEEPIQLPQSTHSLLFTQPVCSIPYLFAVVIVGISYTCLFLASREGGYVVWNIEDGINYPANVPWEVRVAQYLSIIIVLLMEEGKLLF